MKSPMDRRAVLSTASLAAAAVPFGLFQKSRQGIADELLPQGVDGI
ncbi:MAG: hypothetical protein ACR2GC_03670 [Methyloceanibacter sp.]